MTTFPDQPSRYLFFTGKGGVGKTALACARDIIWVGRLSPCVCGGLAVVPGLPSANRIGLWLAQTVEDIT